MSLLLRLCLLVALAILPALALQVINQVELRHERETLVRESALRNAHHAAGEAARILEGARSLLIAITSLPFVRRMDGETCSAYIGDLASRYSQYSVIALLDPSGRPVCGHAPWPNGEAAEHPLFKEAMASGDLVLGRYTPTERSSSPFLPVALPFHDAEDRRAGVAVIGIDLDRLAQEFRNNPMPADADLLLADDAGRIVLRLPERGSRGKIVEPDLRAAFAGNSDGTLERTSPDNIDRIYGYRPAALSPWGLSVAVGVPKLTTFTEIVQGTRRDLLLEGLAALLTVAAALWGGWYFIRLPLQALIRTVARWERGEYEARAGLGNGRSEFGRLGQAFDRMAEAVQRRDAALQQAKLGLEEHVAARTRELSEGYEKLRAEIAEHERTEQALRESEEQFRLLVQGVTDYAIYRLDPQGFITNWNEGAQRIKGYTADEVIRQHFSRFYTEEDRAAGLPARVLETAAREGKYEAEAWRVRKDGSRFWASVVVDALRDEKGRLLGFAKVTRDITERREAEETLKLAQAALAQAQKMEAVGQLTGGIAHDFNNFLTTILGNAELVERRQTGAEEKRFLQGIIRAAERATALTQRLLAFSRRQTLAPSVIDLNRLVTDLTDLLRRALGESIALEARLAEELWRCFVDPNQLESTLLNLVINARDAMPDGGKLVIETGNTYLDEYYAASHADVRPGHYVLLAVSDTGIGMTREILDRAFEPFFTTKQSGKGTGLGLSQVFGFIKQSGGHIKLYSEIGQGTTVKIYLPRYAAADGVAPVRRRMPPNLGAKGETILVVEDDEDVREYCVQALLQLGYRVIDAGDALAALHILEREKEISLLFSDVGLPGMNGRKLADEARRRFPDLLILFSTGYGGPALIHHAILERGTELLAKPFTIESLARKLRQMLDKD